MENKTNYNIIHYIFVSNSISSEMQYQFQNCMLRKDLINEKRYFPHNLSFQTFRRNGEILNDSLDFLKMNIKDIFEKKEITP